MIKFHISKLKNKKKSAYLTTVDLLRQHSNVLYGSGFRESIERRVIPERLHELHVDDGVCQRREESVHNRQKDKQFDTWDILGRPERHVSSVSCVCCFCS